MKKRCDWCLKYGDEMQYHDEEWGVPVRDDALLFEYFVLDTFQAGLSWLTILRKREGFRLAFDNFDAEKISNYGEEKVQTLLDDTGIIRNKLKIRATIGNAQAFLKIKEEFGTFSEYIWQFTGGHPIVNEWKTMKEIPVTTAESDAMSKDLKKRGFKFVGSTTCYAFMQAAGMVNDHIVDCYRYEEVGEG